VKKVTVKDQIRRVAGVSQRFNGTQNTHAWKTVVAASAVRLPGVLASATRNGIFSTGKSDWQYFRAESTLTSKEVERILKSSRLMVEKRERDEMLERIENA